MGQKQTLFTIRALKGKQCFISKEDTIKVVVNMHGRIKSILEGQTFSMREEDFLVINSFEVCELYFASEDSLVVIIEIHRQEIVQTLDINWVPHFECNTVFAETTDRKRSKYRRLHAIILKLLGVYFGSSEEKDTDFILHERFFKVLSYLVNHFQKRNTPLPQLYNKGIRKIVEKVQSSYDQSLSLEEFAKESYLSYNYLSKKFKEEMGISFREYVKEVRVSQAAEELKYTDTSILKVALNNGFSSSKFFHKAFKEAYGVTPKIFREQKRGIVNKKTTDFDDYQQLEKTEAVQILEKYLVENHEDKIEIEDKEQCLVTLSNEGQPLDFPDRILNIGQGNNWLKEENRREISEAVRDLAIHYIRINGFCMEEKSEKFFTLFSKFQQNNLLFEFVLQQEKIPIIVLEIPTEGSEQLAFWYQEQLDFIRQLIQQFGESTVETWRFEWVINWKVSENVVYFSKLIQDLSIWLTSPNIGVCLGNLYSEKQYQKSDQFLSLLVNKNRNLSFFSYHAKPEEINLWEESQIGSLENYQKQNYQILSTLLEKHKLQGEIYLTDWDTLIGEGETFAGTFFRSALFVKDVFALRGKVSALSVWLNAETTQEDPAFLEKGGNSLSLYLLNSLKRPAYLGLQLLDKLRGQLLYQDDQIYIVKHENQVAVLLTNPSYIDPVMSLSSNYLQHQVLEISLIIQKFIPSNYIVKSYSLDKDRGGIYNDWLRLGRLPELDNEMIEYLQKKIMLHFTVYKEAVEEDEVHITEVLSFNACRLLIFKPILFS